MESNIFMYPMEIRCAWCDTHMTWGACQKPGQISHGICVECKKQALDEIEQICSEKEVEICSTAY